MRSIARVAVAALIAIATVAGCGTGTASNAPDASGSDAAASPASPAASSTRPSTKPSPSTALVLPHDDPDLEAKLPDEAEGVKLFKLSVGLVSSVTNEGAASMRDLAKRIGDGSGNFGLAYAGDNQTQKFNLFALRIPGATPNDLLTNYAQLTLEATVGGKVESATLGGRSVVHVTQPDSVIGDVWFYAKVDTIYGVQARTPDVATRLLSLLP